VTEDRQGQKYRRRYPHRYELRVMGPQPDAIVLEDDAFDVVGRAESVLITDRIGQDELRDLLVRISDLGLDLRELRRVSDASPRS
jgi:hypothetical protein